MGFVVMGFVSAAKQKIDIKDAIALSYRILLNQQVLSSKTKIMLKMIIELNWKLLALSLAVINPTLMRISCHGKNHSHTRHEYL